MTSQQRVDTIFADGYGGTLVTRLVRTIGVKEDKAKKVLRAYKQFLVLKAEGDDFDATKLSPPPLVDEMWHLHVLDTKRYQRQCLQAFDRVIHHDPDGGADAVARATRIGSTHLALTKRFGNSFSKRIWCWTEPPPSKELARRVGSENKRVTTGEGNEAMEAWQEGAKVGSRKV